MEYLQNIVDLFNHFESREIKYCHWKSNDHVEEGMAGITDLDILVDRRQYLDIRELLALSGFKQGLQTFGTKIPAVEGYVGCDSETGKLAYIHLHYHLAVGTPRVKEFHLRWENFILDTRVFNKEVEIYTIDPNLELLLLIIRSAVKIRFRDILLNKFGKKYFSGNWVVQKKYLISQVDMNKCTALCQKFMGSENADLFVKIIHSEVNISDLRKFKRACQIRFAASAAYSPWMTNFIMWAREIYRATLTISRRYLGMHIPVARKTFSSGGVLIAFIGSDGSGKSTMAIDVCKWLQWKLDVNHVYLGSGDGSSSMLRKLMKLGQAFLEKRGLLIPKSKTKVRPKGNTEKRGGFYWWAKTCWAIVLSTEKISKLKAAHRGRNQGIIVVSDRYPQTQVKGFNDGPLLWHWLTSKNPILRWLANQESRPYNFAHLNPPDLVLRLNVTPDVALQRDAGMDDYYVRKRIEAVNSLVYPATTRVVEIDANNSVERVFHDICKEVWNEI